MMRRRDFGRLAGGLAAGAALPGMWSCRTPASRKTTFEFEEVGGSEYRVPVKRVTPAGGSFVHTYYDVCPFSPSQRYLAATRLPYQTHNAVLGDPAEVCVIDLEEQTIETVYATKSWGFQTGANLHWGATDQRLYTNDIVNGTAVCVRIDLASGETRAFSGPVYEIMPDETFVFGFPLELLDVTQVGYGVPSPDPANPPSLPPGAAADQGLWRTNLATDEKTLLLRLADVAAKVPEPPPRDDGTFYFWHTKINRQGSRLLQISRCMFPGENIRNAMVFTLDPSGTNLQLIPTDPLWGLSGGHPNWHPDGDHVFRNIPIGGTDRFCQWRSDGTEFRVLSESIRGGGHATIHPGNRFVLTDDFPRRDGRMMVELRFVDLRRQTEQVLCSLPTVDRDTAPEAVLRLDGHPAWNRDYTKVCFQALSGDDRSLFVADLSGVLASA